MATITTNIATSVTTVTESLAHKDISAAEALSKLKAVMIDHVDFVSVSALWQLTNIANDVLAELLPKEAEVFVRQGDRTGPIGTERIGIDAGVLILVRLVMRGLELFDTNDARKQGACELLAHCPNPIGPSATPFADTRGQWDHTHIDSDE